MVSPKTQSQTVNVSEDRKSPEAPVNFTIKLLGDGAELKWQASPTVDVVKVHTMNVSNYCRSEKVGRRWELDYNGTKLDISYIINPFTLDPFTEREKL